MLNIKKHENSVEFLNLHMEVSFSEIEKFARKYLNSNDYDLTILMRKLKNKEYNNEYVEEFKNEIDAVIFDLLLEDLNNE